MAQRSFCILCGKERNGIPIKEDFVIYGIRWFRRNITKNAKNNKLVICKDCYESYKEKRKRFDMRQRLYLTLGIVFAFVSIIVTITSGSSILFSVASSALVIIFMYILSILNYMPSLDMKKKQKK